MPMFVQEADGIFHLRVPFENLTTSVFLLITQQGPVLYDCATTASDVENVILPALRSMDITPQDLRALVISHAHADHSGGTAVLLQHVPRLQVIAQNPQKYENAVFTPADGEMLFGSLQALTLPGHTVDCLGLYDTKTASLLTADALQLRGIGRFGCSLAAPADYVKTIERIRRLAPQRILTAHDYAPYGDKAGTPAEIARYLDGCLDVLKEIESFIIRHQFLSAEDLTLAFRAQHSDWPLLPQTTVHHMLNELSIKG